MTTTTGEMIRVLDRKDGNMMGIVPIDEAAIRIGNVTELEPGEVKCGLASGQSYRTAGCVYEPIAETLIRKPMAKS